MKLRLFLIGAGLLLLLVGVVAWWLMIRMPGRSFRGAPPPLTAEERALRTELLADVQKFGGEIGERNLAHYAQLQAADDFIEHSFVVAGLQTQRDGYQAQGKICQNIEAQITGSSPEIIVVGAHYDTVLGSPGANDNGSGVAALLALARRFSGKPTVRTLRFVAFPNEESGHFQNQEMGSWVYAKGCKARHEKVAGMISLETIGYYSHAAGTQSYPLPWLGAIYPSAGNFLAFVGNVSSRALVRKTIGIFRRGAAIPSEGAALPAGTPGVGWSDQWAFWQFGYPAMMLTDTAPFRYPHYHARTDTPEKLDYDSFARVVAGVQRVVAALAQGSE
ncbi:MAG: M28 family peptidase [Chthoniobacterales bacterium]